MNKDPLRPDEFDRRELEGNSTWSMSFLAGVFIFAICCLLFIANYGPKG